MLEISAIRTLKLKSFAVKLLNVNVNLRQTNVFYSAGFTFKIEENPLRSYPFLFYYLIVNLVKSAIREKKGGHGFFYNDRKRHRSRRK